MTLFVAALATLVGAGLLALVTSRWARLASASGAAGAVLGCALGEVYAVRALLAGDGGAIALRWEVPYGWMRIGVDALSAFFLVPIFGLGAIVAPYGAAYLDGDRGRKALGPPWLAFNALLASMALVVVARQAVLFLVAWEVMSLSAYFCVTFDPEDRDMARGGWVYLVASHIGTAALVAFFLLYARQAGGFDFDAFRAAAPAPAFAAGLTALALAGFGVKAGFVPFHVWLPEAHAAAPSHVSAVMSGVLVNLGLYGILRSVLLLRAPLAWIGPVLMAAGVTGAVTGVALASYQRDIKRVLAYSTIENVGLIALALGTAFWARASGRPEVAALAVASALLHVLDHALMKGLMFLAAGSLLHGAGTKDLERLGGALKRMPRTGSLMILGSVAIAGLPPLNGFVGELLLYLALMRAGVSSSGATSAALMIAASVVALVGAVAVLAFVRLAGIALLGQPRSESAARAHESPALIVWPMAALAAMCVVVGLSPRPFAGALSTAADEILGGHGALAVSRAPLEALAWVDRAVWGLCLLGAAATALAARRGTVRAVTWAGAFAHPTARMQYTAASFSGTLSEELVPRVLRARVSGAPPEGLFPAPVALVSDRRDPLARGFYEPFFAWWADRSARVRWMQQGALHLYIVYILAALLAGLAWSAFASWSSP